jgi:hypothetical protein
MQVKQAKAGLSYSLKNTMKKGQLSDRCPFKEKVFVLMGCSKNLIYILYWGGVLQ